MSTKRTPKPKLLARAPASAHLPHSTYVCSDCGVYGCMKPVPHKMEDK